MNETRRFLRHAVATVAYRATRALENSDAAYGEFAGAGRRPVEILAHVGDLFDWALSAAEGRLVWHESTPLPWAEEQVRFYAALAAFDAYLAGEGPLRAEAEKLLQGPVADALTHVGQLAMLRRMAGAPARRENFYVAEIACGCVGPEQAAAVRPF